MAISVTIALDSLKEQVETTEEAKAAYEEATAIRDDLIRDALANKVAYKQLIRITHLSRERLYAIGNSPSKTYQRT